MVAFSRVNSLVEIFLAYLDVEDGFEALSDVLVIREFEDVFGDILGLPLVR